MSNMGENEHELAFRPIYIPITTALIRINNIPLRTHDLSRKLFSGAPVEYPTSGSNSDLATVDVYLRVIRLTHVGDRCQELVSWRRVLDSPYLVKRDLR